MRPSQAFQILETLRNSFSVPLSRKGAGLSDSDNQTVLDVYQQWLLLMIDLGYLHPENLLRDTRRLWIDMIHADVLDLNGAFAECLQLVRLQSSRGFKGLCKRISSHLYNIIKDDIELMSQGNVHSARRLIQCFAFTSRLSLNDIDLTQQLLEDYMEIEEGIPFEFPRPLIKTLNRYIKSWFGPVCPRELIPQHGPGGIAEKGRCSIQTKYELLGSDSMLRYSLGDPWWVVDGVRQDFCRTSKTIFVPKSYKTFRTISMEPATLQYFQQGVWGIIKRVVARDDYLSSHIGFEDQSRNRQLAQRGSVDRNYATLDLSAASDSVSYDLVKQLFKGTWLLRYIVTLRSSQTLLPDGRTVKLRKFAPMGSSLCFPIETIIFASLCEHVTRVNHVKGDYSVFGDDIIVPTNCSESMMRLLEVLGFRVNREKSFFDSSCWFRESCGGEYCDGFDVTPMRVSRRYASRERLVRQAKLVSKANEAYERGFRSLRYFYLFKLRQLGFIPLFGDTEVLADNYTNYHTKRRWNPRLQRIEVSVTTDYSKYAQKDLESQSEDIRYRHWLESTAIRDRSCDFASVKNRAYRRWLQDRSGRSSFGDGFESVICRPLVITREAWRSKPYESPDQRFIDKSLGRSNS